MCVAYHENCITVSSHFPTMSVTYQANYLAKGRDGEKQGGKKKKENNGGNSGELWQLRRCQSTA